VPDQRIGIGYDWSERIAPRASADDKQIGVRISERCHDYRSHLSGLYMKFGANREFMELTLHRRLPIAPKL
jgi:hypothetical protein